MKNVKTTKTLSSFAGTSMNMAAMKQVVGGIAYCRNRHEVFICPDLL